MSNATGLQQVRNQSLPVVLILVTFDDEPFSQHVFASLSIILVHTNAYKVKDKIHMMNVHYTRGNKAKSGAIWYMQSTQGYTGIHVAQHHVITMIQALYKYMSL